MAEKLKTATLQNDADFARWKQELATPDAPGASPDTAPVLSIDSLESIPSAVEIEDVKQEIAEQPDAETRYTDAELLGKRYPVRQLVNSMANSHMRRIESARAKRDNLRDTPGKLREQFSVARAEGKYNRHKAKADAVDHLPDNHPLKKRRLAKLERVENKLNAAKAQLETRTNRMESRTESVTENFESRRAEYVAELKGRKESALARKAMRHELRAQGASRAERKAILNDMPHEQIQRVGRVAAQAETSRRAYGQAERQRQKASKQELKAHSAIEQNEAKITQYTEEAENARKTLAELRGGDDLDNPAEGSLPAKEAHVAELQTRADELADDDPDKATLLAQIDEAKHAVDIVKNREIPYWESVAEQSAQRARELELKRNSLKESLEIARIVTSGANRNIEAQKKILDRDLEAQATAAQEALVHEPTEAIEVQEVAKATQPEAPVAEASNESGEDSSESLATEAEYRQAFTELRRLQREMAEARQTRNNAYDAYNAADAELKSPNSQFLPEQQKKDYSYHRDVLKDEYDEAQSAYDAAETRAHEANEKLAKIEQALEKSRRNVQL